MRCGKLQDVTSQETRHQPKACATSFGTRVPKRTSTRTRAQTRTGARARIRTRTRARTQCGTDTGTGADTVRHGREHSKAHAESGGRHGSRDVSVASLDVGADGRHCSPAVQRNRKTWHVGPTTSHLSRLRLSPRVGYYCVSVV